LTAGVNASAVNGAAQGPDEPEEDFVKTYVNVLNYFIKKCQNGSNSG